MKTTVCDVLCLVLGSDPPRIPSQPKPFWIRKCLWQLQAGGGFVQMPWRGGLGELCMGRWQISDLQFALILHLDTDSEEQTLPFPVPSERLPLRRMSPFSSTLNLQPSFPGRSYFDFRSSPHQLSLHSSLQSLNAPGELSSSDLSS